MFKVKHKRIVFWQDFPSPHQAPWIRSLANIFTGGRVIGVFQREADPCVTLGWSPPDYGRAEVVIRPDRFANSRLLHDDSDNTVHVFSGMVHNAALNAVLNQTLSSRATVALLSEGRDSRGFKGALRLVHSVFHERRYSERVDFVLAVGHVGIRWYIKCGYDPAKLFPFCYAAEKHPCEDHQNPVNGLVTIASIGRLVSSKRVDLLLQAIARVSSGKWRLEIVGEGKGRSSLESMSKRLGLREKVTFTGAICNPQVRRKLDKIDIFVFSSKDDGWGAVVNEALMSGVPVICSDYPGAADLVVPGLNGDLFECDSLDSLTCVLDKWIAKGPLAVSERERIRDWSRCIEGDAVARYFIGVLDYLEGMRSQRPVVPWLLKSGDL
jgi:glycosyltransferase involved in cell wall biosynthesis